MTIVDTVSADLRGLVRVVVLVALALVAVALAVGPSRGARRVRALAVAALAGRRRGDAEVRGPAAGA